MNYFKTIYRLAKQKDKKALSVLIASGVCIDVYQTLHHSTTPIMRLAMENDQESVNFLIYYFNASINNALMGALHSKDQAFINTLKDRGANAASISFNTFHAKERQLMTDTDEGLVHLLNAFLNNRHFNLRLIDVIITLTAEAGYQKICHRFLDLCNLDVRRKLGHSVLKSAARAGHTSWVLALLTDQATHGVDFQLYFLSAVTAAAENSQIQLLNVLLTSNFQFTSLYYSDPDKKDATLCPTSTVYESIAQGIYNHSPWTSIDNGGSISGEKNALRVLVFIDDANARIGIAEAIIAYKENIIQHYKNACVDLKKIHGETQKLFEKVSNVRHAMQEKHLNYDDALSSLSVLTPEVLALIDYDCDTHCLNPDTTSIIAGYLIETSQPSAYKLINSEYQYKQQVALKTKECVEQQRQVPLIEKWKEKRAHVKQREAGLEMANISFWAVNKKTLAPETETYTLSDDNPHFFSLP